MELMPFLDIAAALDSALEVLGLLGNRDDVPLVASYLETSFGEDSLGNMKSSAIQALTNSGDGSALPAVRCLIGDAQPGANSVFGALEYISHCGGRDDLTSIERLARRQIAAAGPFSLDVAFEATKSMYMIAGPSVIPVIRSIVADVPMSESKLGVLGK
jgi:hypothetical protein